MGAHRVPALTPPLLDPQRCRRPRLPAPLSSRRSRPTRRMVVSVSSSPMRMVSPLRTGRRRRRGLGRERRRGRGRAVRGDAASVPVGLFEVSCLSLLLAQPCAAGLWLVGAFPLPRLPGGGPPAPWRSAAALLLPTLGPTTLHPFCFQGKRECVRERTRKGGERKESSKKKGGGRKMRKTVE